MRLMLDDLYAMQSELDERIFKQHQITRAETSYKRVLALIVELGECVNETRCFKFWSVKGSQPKEVILEEFVDGIHFLLSIGLDLNDQSKHIESKETSDDLSKAYLEMFRLSSSLSEDYTLTRYYQCFSCYLGIAELLGFSELDIHSFYMMKNKENHSRQNNNY